MERQVITIPRFTAETRDHLLKWQTELLYNLFKNQKELMKNGITNIPFVENAKDLYESAEGMVFDDTEKRRKEHTEMLSRLIGKYWKVTYADDNKIHSYIFPYEISDSGRVSMLYCCMSEYNSGYSTTIKTEHDDMIDGTWGYTLTFTEVTSNEFAKAIHDSVDDVIAYRHWKLNQPKPTFNVTWEK